MNAVENDLDSTQEKLMNANGTLEEKDKALQVVSCFDQFFLLISPFFSYFVAIHLHKTPYDAIKKNIKGKRGGWGIRKKDATTWEWIVANSNQSWNCDQKFGGEGKITSEREF